jgi:NADH-quinone oxidoreductase subunit A
LNTGAASAGTGRYLIGLTNIEPSVQDLRKVGDYLGVVGMLIEYIAIGVFLVLTTLVALIAIGLGNLFGPKRPQGKKSMPYESGMNPIGPGTRRIPVRFYLIAVLFILFDIEVVFFIPWALVFNDFVKAGNGLFMLGEMLVFIVILLVGYVYAWKKGALEWE